MCNLLLRHNQLIMWPFKKKKPLQSIVSKTCTTVICIPGIWNNWDEFILSIVNETAGDYIVAGGFLINAKKERHYSVEFCEKDDKIKDSFRYAGKDTAVSELFLDEIDKHKHIIYLSGTTGNLIEAEHIAFAAKAILKSGGIGTKIETTGKAFEKDVWYMLLQNFEESNLYEMFVVDSITDEEGTVFSCGMHNLGYKDTIVSSEEFQEAVSLIRLFNYYQIVDKPTIEHRQTFTATLDSPMYRIINEDNQPYKGNELFENPFGMWRLSREK